MKINETTAEIETTSVESSEFSVEMSGKIMHIFISGMYSDKPNSIMREVWSNAFDAHAEAKNLHVPFDVVVATGFNPEFRCRDYGAGLSHAFMLTSYTKIGFSTKAESNEAVGKWGMGRMTPLSYANSFSVTSIHKGKKAVYVVNRGANNIPKIDCLAPPFDTQEPSGLEVSFPVETADLREFKNAAIRASLGFDVKPKVKNLEEDFEFPIPQYTIQGPDYKFFERTGTFHGVYAKMGCVVYPIDSNIIKTPFDNCILEFKIGELEVTSSREDLSYGPNDPTVKSINDKILAVKEHIQKDLVAGELEDHKVNKRYFAYWEKLQAINSALPRQLQISSNMYTLSGETVSNYVELDLKTELGVSNPEELNWVNVQPRGSYYKKPEMKTIKKPKLQDCKVKEKLRYNDLSSYFIFEGVKFKPDGTTDSLSSHVARRVATAFCVKSNGYTGYQKLDYYYILYNAESSTAVESVKQLKKVLKPEKVIDANLLPLLSEAALENIKLSTARTATPIKYKELNTSTYQFVEKAGNVKDFASAYFIKACRECDGIDDSYFLETLSDLAKTNLLTPDRVIVSVMKSEWGKVDTLVRKEPQNFSVITKVKHIKSAVEGIKKLQEYINTHSILGLLNLEFLDLIEEKDQYVANLTQLPRSLNNYPNLNNPQSNQEFIVKHLSNDEFKRSPEVARVSTVLQSYIDKTYPLLKFISSTYTTNKKELHTHVRQYINFIVKDKTLNTTTTEKESI